MKRFLPALVALCLWTSNVWAQEKPKEPEVRDMPDGSLRVQIYDKQITRDDFAEMLNIQMWKIRFVPLKKGQYVRVVLELRTPGKEPYLMYDFTDKIIAKGEYVFGLQPVEGDEINSSPKVRFYHRFSVFYTDEAGDAGNKQRGNSKTSLNPFLNLGQPFSYDLPPLYGSGKIVLMGFSPLGKYDGPNTTADDDPNASELVVVATLQDPPPKR